MVTSTIFGHPFFGLNQHFFEFWMEKTIIVMEKTIISQHFWMVNPLPMA